MNNLTDIIQRDQEGAHAVKWLHRQAFVEQWQRRAESDAAAWVDSFLEATGYLSADLTGEVRRSAKQSVGKGIEDHMTERDTALKQIAALEKKGDSGSAIETLQRRIIEIGKWLDGVTQ